MKKMVCRGMAWHGAIVSPTSIFIWRKGWRNNALPSGERPVSLCYVLKKSQEANRVVLTELRRGRFRQGVQAREETCIVDSSIHIVNSWSARFYSHVEVRHKNIIHSKKYVCTATQNSQNFKNLCCRLKI